MSFTHCKSTVDYGDIIAIYIGYRNIFVQKVEKNKIFQTRFGALRHNDLISKEYGTKFHCKKGWIYLLHITPEIWTLTLPHRTQILYSTDISLITCLLYLKPGSIAIEAGTGSGSLSHAICRTIAPNGYLYTFDFHQDRVNIAKSEFTEHGLSNLVTIQCKDVCNEGFNLEDIADAVFLDLPKPWKAIQFASKALKKHGGRICCFSPCIEQVQKTCQALSESHFDDIQTMECLLRPYEIRKYTLEKLLSEESYTSKIASKKPRTERRNKTETDVKEEVNDEDDNDFQVDDNDVEEAEGENRKNEAASRINIEDNIDVLHKRSEHKLASSTTTAATTATVTEVVCVPTIQIPGHTGFLTFATKVF